MIKCYTYCEPKYLELFEKNPVDFGSGYILFSSVDDILKDEVFKNSPVENVIIYFEFTDKSEILSAIWCAYAGGSIRKFKIKLLEVIRIEKKV